MSDHFGTLCIKGLKVDSRIPGFTKYTQTCSNDHLHKVTTCLRRPMLSPAKPIPIQLLLYKTTLCLKRPGTTFFVPQMKKKLSKTATANLYSAKKWEAVHKKLTSLQLYLLYCYFIMQSLFNANIRLHKVS